MFPGTVFPGTVFPETVPPGDGPDPDGVEILAARASAEALAKLEVGQVDLDPVPAELDVAPRPVAEELPDTERRTVQLTDPLAMRALAHPVRMALLEVLSHAGTLTATQASELLGESPANCAFHLRTLGKYGLVEEAGGGRGRERPWRRAFTTLNLSILHEDPQAASAAEVLSQFWTDHMLNRARANLGKRHAWPPAWLDAMGESQSFSYLTLEEAEELLNDMQEILYRYKGRVNNPSLRPPGALPVELLLLGYPVMDLVGLAIPEDDAIGSAGDASAADEENAADEDSATPDSDLESE